MSTPHPYSNVPYEIDDSEDERIKQTQDKPSMLIEKGPADQQRSIKKSHEKEPAKITPRKYGKLVHHTQTISLLSDDDADDDEIPQRPKRSLSSLATESVPEVRGKRQRLTSAGPATSDKNAEDEEAAGLVHAAPNLGQHEPEKTQHDTSSAPAPKPFDIREDRKEQERARLERLERGREAGKRRHPATYGKPVHHTQPVSPLLFYGSDTPIATSGGGGGQSFADRFRAVKTVRPTNRPTEIKEDTDDDIIQVADTKMPVAATKVPANSQFPALKSSVVLGASSQLQFPKGVVKKTFVEGKATRTADDITIEEVLQKRTLVLSLLSSFQYNYEWIMNLLPLRKPDYNIILVMHGKAEADRRAAKDTFEGLPRMELVFPNMEGQVNCMHSKLMLLFHKAEGREWLRIVVPTANLTDYDWGQMGGVMENMVFLIDLPKLADPIPEQTFFMDELIYFCNRQDIPERVVNNLAYFDFSETREMAFVHTIGGSHSDNRWKRTGFCGLGRAIKKLGYQSGKGLEVDYVTSSLGAAKAEFITNIYRAAQGHTGIKELVRRNKRPLKSTSSKPATDPFGRPTKKAGDAAAAAATDGEESDSEEETVWANIEKRFRVYFPSNETVMTSKGGPNCGGTICFRREWWNQPAFPKPLFRECNSVRSGMLMHNKVRTTPPSHGHIIS